MFLNSREQIGLLLNQPRSRPRDQMEHLLTSALANVGFEQRPQGRLTGMSFKRSNLAFKIVTNFDDRSGRRHRDRWAVGQGEARCAVVELLGSVRSYFAADLVGKAVAASSPVKRQRGENRSHGMVGMPGNGAVRTKGDHHVRPEPANVKS